MKHNDKAAFHMDLTAPSIFTSGKGDFAGLGPTGGSRSQIATRAVMQAEKKTGRSPGSIAGLSSKGDDLIEMGLARRITTGRR